MGDLDSNISMSEDTIRFPEAGEVLEYVRCLSDTNSELLERLLSRGDF